MSEDDERPDVLAIIQDMIAGRNDFLSNDTIRSFPFVNRNSLVSRYMINEAMYLEFINRIYLYNIQAQATARAIINFTLPSMMNSFMDPVTVTPSTAQINSSLEDFQTTSNCAICQDAISSGGCKIRQCGHVYHRTCIVNWFSMSVRCPVCRHDIREAGLVSQTSAVSEQTTSPQANQ